MYKNHGGIRKCIIEIAFGVFTINTFLLNAIFYIYNEHYFKSFRPIKRRKFHLLI